MSFDTNVFSKTQAVWLIVDPIPSTTDEINVYINKASGTPDKSFTNPTFKAGGVFIIENTDLGLASGEDLTSGLYRIEVVTPSNKKSDGDIVSLAVDAQMTEAVNRLMNDEFNESLMRRLQQAFLLIRSARYSADVGNYQNALDKYEKAKDIADTYLSSD